MDEGQSLPLEPHQQHDCLAIRLPVAAVQLLEKLAADRDSPAEITLVQGGAPSGFEAPQGPGHCKSGWGGLGLGKGLVQAGLG